MSSNVRPESMERITTLAQAEAFIEEQVAEVRAQVGDKKVHVENRFFLRLFFSSIILVLLKGRFFYEISTIIFK